MTLRPLGDITRKISHDPKSKCVCVCVCIYIDNKSHPFISVNLKAHVISLKSSRDLVSAPLH
jgi:hypothetical protein